MNKFNKDKSKSLQRKFGSLPLNDRKKRHEISIYALEKC